MTEPVNKEEFKLVDNEIIDLNDFNSIEIEGKNKNTSEEKKDKKNVYINTIIDRKNMMFS